MMLTISWLIMALVIWSVWVYSRGEAKLGNQLTVALTILGMIYFYDKGDWAFFTLHMILFNRSAWMIWNDTTPMKFDA